MMRNEKAIFLRSQSNVSSSYVFLSEDIEIIEHFRIFGCTLELFSTFSYDKK